MGYNKAAENSISNNNIKLTADKIIKDLDQLREEGKKSRRRWIWELMQNAKDVPNAFENVSIEIVLKEGELIFAHNGNPFTIDNLTGLVQQVSSKHSANRDKDVTGKFGTGFIATHLLSDIVTVKGVLQEDDEIAKEFSFELDRSGEISEDLIPSIKTALIDLNNIDDSEKFQSIENYEENRKESDLNTKFCYSLSSETIKTAEIGINDLIKTLPTALVFLKSIKQVRILDFVNERNLLFRNESPIIDYSEYEEVCISIIDELKSSNSKVKNFIVKSKNDIQQLIETIDFSTYELVPNAENTPFIYRDFPLIGTEKFYFPFVLNGKTFNPTERRDSIYLNGNSNKVNQNKLLLENAIDFSLEFVDYLISKNAKNLYTVCLSSLPNYDFDSDDSENDSKDWYVESVQKKYRQHLVDKKIVRHKDKNCALSDVRFPTSNEHDYPELRNLITEYLGETKVPMDEEQEKWIYFLGPENEMTTWGLELDYGLLDLVNDLDGLDNISDFTASTDVYSWLNRLYKALKDLDQSTLHNSYKLVPNHYGEFKRLPTLWIEEVSENDQAFLPDPYLDLLKSLGEDWPKDLIHREINILKKAHQKKSMSDLNTAINSIFNQESFLQKEHSLAYLLRAHSIVSPNSKEDSFQRSILDIANAFFKKELKLVRNEYASKYNLEIVHRLLIQSINNQIEKTENLSNLALELDKSKEESTIWLDNYLTLLDTKTDFSKFLKEGKIIPNRTEDNVFCHYDEISNYGVEEQPLDKDLLSILSKLNNEKDYFKELIADGIGIKVSKTINFERLGNDVIHEVELIERDKAFEENREALLELINWTEVEKELTSSYASKLSIIAGRIFYILTIENSENREDVMKILRNSHNIGALAGIVDNTAFVNQIDKLVKLFPNGISDKVMNFAKEDARIKKEFNNLLEVGSKVELLFVKTLEQYEISSNREKIIHAGGGAYDVRVYNPDTKRSFYIELKSCKYENTEPINLAVSQVKRAVKEVENENFAIVIIERPADNVMDEDYVKVNAKYFKHPGKHLGSIVDNFDTINKSANTDNLVDLKMDFAEFKGSLNYEWTLNEVGNNGFDELLIDIKNILT